MQEVEERLDKIKADLLCESVSVGILRRRALFIR